MKLHYLSTPRANTRWLKREADKIKPLLPATQTELVKRTGYAAGTVARIISVLRQKETVYTVLSGKKISYEIKDKCND